MILFSYQIVELEVILAMLNSRFIVKYNIFFVVKEDTLQDMVNHMSEKTGLVHQMPFTSDRNGFAATLEKVRTSKPIIFS